ncbi:MAG: alkaline phosphatase D family protein [Rhodospirillaceae bacterium]
MFSRRLFMASTGAALWVPTARAQSSAYHFTLGVASGCPRPNSVVLWTRLAPKPLQGGGMPAGLTQVRYRLCSDAAMRRTVQDGYVPTSDAKGHAVHVLAQGLEPGREYWYQFYFGQDESPVGRTRTADPKAKTSNMAVATCQHWETGYFAAYRDLAEWAPDCVVHVGDYIYEGGMNSLGKTTQEIRGRILNMEIVRQHDGPEIVSLWDYRNRYGLYKSDPHLQAAHAASPWIVAMDDHEIDNNWAADIPQDPDKQTPDEFTVRKRAALQAYWEHMPLEMPPTMNGLQMYGAFRFGPMHVNLLDTRQFRSDQACDPEVFPGDDRCDDAFGPERTMTGPQQEAWLMEQLRTSDAKHNVLASQTWFGPVQYTTEGRSRYNMDQWDGYPAQRQRIIDALVAHDVSNPVVVSGDWHSAVAMKVHQNPDDMRTPVVAHNFAATSISSNCPWAADMYDSRDANPHMMYLDGDQRGYLRCSADQNDFTAVFRTVANPWDANSQVGTDQEIRTGDS